MQLSHGSSHGHSGVNSRGGINVVGNPGFNSNTNGVVGSIPGILPTSASIVNRNAVPGLGVSPILGNAGPRITSSMGNMVAGGNIGRISSGGLSIPGLASRLNLNGSGGSSGLGVQGQNRLMSGVLPQGMYILVVTSSLKWCESNISHKKYPIILRLSSYFHPVSKELEYRY